MFSSPFVEAVGTLAEWLTRCPAKAIPSGASVGLDVESLTENNC